MYRCSAGIANVASTKGRLQNGEKTSPIGFTLRAALTLFFPEYPPVQAQPGDILLITIAKAPRHVAILTGSQTIIHAYQDIGRCAEQSWIDPWRRDTTSAFRPSDTTAAAIQETEF